ncbi:MAG: hypothetical protein H8E37_09780 [Planctomycetes bacterium]|nr:hypothetical protein [Planctomycetota bacterium]
MGSLNTEDGDWRRRGQERYLMQEKWVKRSYRPYREGWDHDHCEFCWKTFSLHETDLNAGYSTSDEYRWICEQCFSDFRDEFQWEIVD